MGCSVWEITWGRGALREARVELRAGGPGGNARDQAPTPISCPTVASRQAWGSGGGTRSRHPSPEQMVPWQQAAPSASIPALAVERLLSGVN